MIDLYDFTKALNEASLPTDIINPSASGTAANIILQTWKVKHGQRFITNFVLGEMGAGLPYSIGAAIATGKRVIHVEGDGGFQLNIHSLETIRQLNLPIIMFIINNNGYHSIRTSQMSAFGRLTGADDTSGVTLPDIESIAHAYNLPCWSMYKLDSMHENIYYSEPSANGWSENEISTSRMYKFELDKLKPPCIVEVEADRSQQYRHRVPSKLVDGKMTTARMDEVD